MDTKTNYLVLGESSLIRRVYIETPTLNYFFHLWALCSRR